MRGCGKVLSLLIGIILGIVLTFGGIAFGGYLLLTREGMIGLIADQAGEGMPFEFTEEAKEKSLYGYGIDIYAAISDAQNSVLADIEAAIGISGLIENISSFIGIEPEVLRATRLSNLAEDLSEAITLGGIFNAFDITPPDLPLFSREDVLNMPITRAFENMGTFVLQDFVKIETEGDNASSPILIKLKDVSLEDLSNNMEEVIKEIKLEEMTKIITAEEAEQAKQDYVQEFGTLAGFEPLEPSSPIMQTLKRREVTLGDLMENMDNILQEISMSEMTVIVAQEDIDNDAAAYEAEHGNLDGFEPRALSSPFMINLKDVTLGELMNNADGIINDMTLEELIEITEDSNAALKALRDTKIGELGSAEADATIKNIKIADLIEITEDSSEVMKYFRDSDTTLSGIDDAIKRMRIKNVIKIDDDSTTLIKSLKDAALDTFIDDNGTPDDESDDFEVLGIEETIKTLPLSGIIDITEDSSLIMQSLADAGLETYTDEDGVVHKGIDDTVRTLKLSQMVNIVTDEQAALDPELTPSSRFLQALKDCPLESYEDEEGFFHKGVDEKIQETALGDLVEVGESHIWDYLSDKTFSEIGTAIDDMTLGDAVKIIEADPVEPGDPERSHAILIALKDKKISEIGTELPQAIEDCLLVDIITIDENSPNILQALAARDTTVGTLSDTLSLITLGEMYPDQQGGALSLIDSDITIDDLPDAMTNAITHKTLEDFETAGLLENVPVSLKDKTIQQIVDIAALMS